jgi:periodic tryptophan protein 2
VVCVIFRPDGDELAVSSLDGQLSFWSVANAVQTGSIEGRHDLEVGRREGDRVTAKKLTGGV